MKIIISPAKTFTFNKKVKNNYPVSEYNFSDTYKNILKFFQEMNKKQLQSFLKLSDKLTTQVWEYYNNFSKIKIPAILLFDGIVFKQIKIEEYNDKQLKWLQNNVIILDAFYGALKPFDLISPYRLDFTKKLPVKNKEIYEKLINKLLAKEDQIINLASKEFSSLIKHPNVLTPKLNNTYSINIKKARGFELHKLILNSK